MRPYFAYCAFFMHCCMICFLLFIVFSYPNMSMNFILGSSNKPEGISTASVFSILGLLPNC